MILAIVICTTATNGVAAKPQKVRDFKIASNNSNAADIYKNIVSLGTKEICTYVDTMENIGRHIEKKACSVIRPMERVTIKVNNILWWYKKIVNVQGDVHCWQKWITQTNGPHRPSGTSLWYFCEFKGMEAL